METLGTPKVKTAWAMFDWSNSVYNLVITATIFPIYYQAITSIKDENGVIINNIVNFLGFNFKNTALYDFAIAFAFLLLCCIIPLLSGIADTKGNKRIFMQIFSLIGAISCICMYFITSETIGLSITLAITACIGYGGGLVFYNAYLPEIAPIQEQDKLSAKGFALGYAGSAILLIVCLIMIQKFETFGFETKSAATRISFLITGIWWLVFGQISILFLPNHKAKDAVSKTFADGYIQLKNIYHKVVKQKNLKNYLLAFFTYSMGVQTVMLVATHFAGEEIKMQSEQLITTILIIQFVALAGSYIFSGLSYKMGNLLVLLIAVCIWALICIVTYLFVYETTQFYIIAAFVGLVMGGIQSLSRSTYSKMLPSNEEHVSYFSFYDICEKLSIVLGMFTFGLISQISSNMRTPVLALIIFFVIGFLLLLKVKKGVDVN